MIVYGASTNYGIIREQEINYHPGERLPHGWFLNKKDALEYIIKELNDDISDCLKREDNLRFQGGILAGNRRKFEQELKEAKL